jgi:hypothetical protein
MMTPFSYRDDGVREPFNPARARDSLAGCLLCGSRIVVIGLFAPYDDATQQIVLTLRRQPLRPNSTPGVLYGLCALHGAELSCGTRQRADRLIATIENILRAMAARVTVQ